MSKLPKTEWVIVSDVGSRDGIGVEFLIDDEIVLEIFRDDTKKTREVTLYKKEISLSLVEEAIAKFKKEIPWDFLD
jgi:predicted nucleotidyltransferase